MFTRCWRQFLRDERGSAYTLSYVMVLPFVGMFLILIAETSMILLAKLGTTYAAYAGVRTGVVWRSAGGPGVAEAKARQAVVQAMTPFANGLSDSPAAGPAEEDLLAVYRDATSSQASLGYVRRKFRYAQNAVQVSLADGPPAAADRPWDRDVTLRVEYRYAFHMPVLSRMFGSADGKLRIVSEATLPSESPRNEKQSLGISYASP